MERKEYAYDGLGFITRLLAEKSKQYEDLKKELEKIQGSEDLDILENTNRSLVEKLNRLTEEIDTLKHMEDSNISCGKAEKIMEWYRNAPDCIKKGGEES